jgi:drug/metabolite transporter (DMT)-like permease
MNTESTAPAPPRTLLIAAFATVYVVWGSTYLAIRVAIETMPPFLMAGVRFATAGAALFLWLRLRGVLMPTRLQWRNAAIAGVFLLVGGNGLVVWAEQTLPSGLAALLIGLTPMWFALLDWARPAGTRPQPQTLLGIVVGFSGVALLIAGRGLGTGRAEMPLPGVIAMVLAGISWTGGSLWSRRVARPESPWMNAAAQMVCGGAGMLLLGLLAGEPAHVQNARFSLRSLAALGYLIVFGSWIGFSAYVWLLKVSTPPRVATYAYINPVIAVLLGNFLLSEPFTGRMFAATAVILAGVIITTLPKRTPAPARIAAT